MRGSLHSKHGDDSVGQRLKQAVKRPLLRAGMLIGRRIANRFERPVDPQRPWRVLVIQLGGLGDVVRVFPLLERIQAAQPDATIALLTNQAPGLLELYPGARRPSHVPFDLRWGYLRKLRALARLRRSGVNLVLSPVRGDGMLECAVIAWLTGAAHRIGFEQDGAGFLHTYKQPLSAAHSLLEQNLRLLEPLGIAPGEARQRLQVPEKARAFAAEFYATRMRRGSLRVVIHPWASSQSAFRAWPFKRYAALVERLLRERDAAVVVLGSEREANPDKDLLNALPSGRVHDLTGRTGLGEAAALIAQCDLFIGNDSGLLHMALAADVPTVAIFGATPPAQLLPPGARAMAVRTEFPCQPCYRHQPLFDYKCAHAFRCLAQLPVDVVLAEALRLTARCGQRDAVVGSRLAPDKSR